MPLFEIAFHGQVRPGVTPEQARARIGQLFQVGDEPLNVLFSGRRVVIKQGLDEASADKYRQAIERAGAVCSVDSMEQEETPASFTSAAANAGPSAQPHPTGGTSVRPRDAYMAAFSEVDAPDFGIAPVGADMQDEYEEFVDLPIDLSALSLAPAGSDLEQLRPEVAPVKPNIDHLRLQD
ncbi:MAG: hypothetical protein KBT85_08160 [Pseudomonas sp.]|nr:hypothetical protein [Pseudomonas sp.]